jgi:hypothetical protein
MTSVVIDRDIVPDYSDGHINGQAGATHSSLFGDTHGIRNTVRELLGDKIRLSESMSMGDLGYHTGYPHTTTSLPYAIHGTATVISLKVAQRVASGSDAIRSILGVSFQHNQKVIVKRKYIVGGQAIITPER